jgi:hypothetical protein
MDYLARKFLNGEYLGWKETKKLYRHYKKYCHIVGVGVLDLSVVDELIEWEMAFSTGSIILRNGEKPEPSDGEVFNTATLIGEMEYWFYRLRETDKTLSDVWLMAVMNREKGIDVAEKLRFIVPGDSPEKRFYWAKRVDDDLTKAAARKIVKIRKKVLTFGEKSVII